MRRLLLVALAFAAVAAFGSVRPAHASASIQYGIQDDAWLVYGPGTLEERLDRLDDLGVDLVRYTLVWSSVEPTKSAANWGQADDVLHGLRDHGIGAVVTLYGTPRWANGGRAGNWAPKSTSTFAAFARRAAKRYGFVRRWLIWNEPNQRRWLRPTSPAVYTRMLLNPAYGAIHSVNHNALVGGGVTAPRAAAGGISPVEWIRGMGAAHARLDAYAHNPYALSPDETPFGGGCDHCETITISTLDRLLREVNRSFGAKRIWLTEFGYQTNPPDRFLGVSKALQARYLADAALRAYEAPRVDMLIQYLVTDEPELGRWQSGLLTAAGRPKPSYRAFALPLAQLSRVGLRTTVWGMVRPRLGEQPYSLQEYRDGRWQFVSSLRTTGSRGIFTATVRAGHGAKLRLWSPGDRTYSTILVVA